MAERQNFFEAVLIIVLKDNQVLLQKRKNTGWMDGWYDVPSGHVERGETILNAAVREVDEETGLKAAPDDLELIHISQADTDKVYTYFIFKVRRWEGRPNLREPDMAEELGFHPLNHLPDKIPPYTKSGLDNLNSSAVTFSYFGADKF